MRPGRNKSAKNVMIRSFRSKLSRNLEDKYLIDWNCALGEGAYGKVYLAKNKTTQEEAALKKIDKRYTDTAVFKTETAALLRIHGNGGHPNICGLRDMYESPDFYYLVFDLVPGGEMFEHLINYGAYSEADASRLMREVASALAFLHGVNVVHADLKPENIMLSSDMTSDGTIKIVDFGSAVCLTEEERRRNAERKSFVAKANGTTAYWSPERFQLNVDAEAPVDMWGVGVVLFIMLAGVHPYDLECCATDEDIAETLLCKPEPPMEHLEDISESARDLIKRLLTPNPRERLTADDMMKHPWVMGTTASEIKITNSGRNLYRYENLRSEIEAGIFQALLSPVDRLSSGGVDIIKKAFDVFDEEGKGFVSNIDVGRIVEENTGEEFMAQDGESLGFSEFSSIALKDLRYKHFSKGECLTRAGEIGESMYFIRSGVVELVTESGAIVYVLRAGEFFGEECILNEGKLRTLTSLCNTPVDVIEITRNDFDRFSSSSTGSKVMLETAFSAKTLGNTKSLIRCCNNIKRHKLKEGTIVYKENAKGYSMFLLDEGKIDMTKDGRRLFSITPGEVFGESALLSMTPRESTAICTEDCILSEIKGSDFLPILESSPETADALRDINRKRMFKMAASNVANRSFSLPNLRRVFDEVDEDGNGILNYNEIKTVIRKLDPNYPEEEIEDLMSSIDMNADNGISFKEFENIFKWCM